MAGSTWVFKAVLDLKVYISFGNIKQHFNFTWSHDVTQKEHVQYFALPALGQILKLPNKMDLQISTTVISPLPPLTSRYIRNVVILFCSVFSVIKNICKEDRKLNIYILLPPILPPNLTNLNVKAYSLYPDTLQGFQVRKMSSQAIL